LQLTKSNFLKIKITVIQQPYTIVNPTVNYVKEPFKLKPVAGSVTPVYPGNSSHASQKNYQQSSAAKNDSQVLHDFFGALNY
jgi:hypothetical protein